VRVRSSRLPRSKSSAQVRGRVVAALALIALAPASGGRRAHASTAAVSDDPIWETIRRADIAACEKEAKTQGRFGDVVVTVWPPASEGGSLRFQAAATKSLGARISLCVEQALTPVMRSPPVPVPARRNDQPVTHNLTLGVPASLLPPFESISPLWARRLSPESASRESAGRELDRLLAPHARLSPEGCLWLPGTSAMQESLHLWKLSAGAPTSRLWDDVFDEIVASPRGSWSRPAALTKTNHVLLTTKLSRRGLSAATLYDPAAGHGNWACLTTLDHQGPRGSLRAAVAQRGACWSGDLFAVLTAPAIEFPERRYEQVSVSDTGACALDARGDVQCCGLQPPALTPQRPGPFLTVARGARHACAIRSDRTVECWGDNQYGRTSPPAGRFRLLSSAEAHTCGLRLESTIACWGANYDEKFRPESGRFSRLAVHHLRSIALQSDGRAVVWNTQARTAASGRFREVSAASEICAVDPAGKVARWDGHTFVAATDGRFERAYCSGKDRGCGLKRSGEIACWSDPDKPRLNPPTAPMKSLHAAGDTYCGVTDAGEIACWGSKWLGEVAAKATRS
jgi:hypothetical protein